MKKLHVWGILCLAFCFVHQSYAQEFIEPTCDQKAETVLEYKSIMDEVPIELIDEMIEYITPCAEESYGAAYPAAAYAKGLLHFRKGDYTFFYGRRIELSYLHMARAAINGYPPAMFTHRLNLLTSAYRSNHYIDYNGISRDFQKLVDQDYKKDISNYVLGYLTLKNLTSNADFTSSYLVNKAKTHFENSNHPMAKHWLAIMHYYGYGVPKDKTKALQMLSENDIFNSRTLKQHLQNQDNDWIPISAEERFASLDNYNTNYQPITIIGNDRTTFQGHFIEYDWTAAGVKRRIPVTLTIIVQEEYERYRDIILEFTINGETITKSGSLRKPSNTSPELQIGFGQLTPIRVSTLENQLLDHPDKTTLTYDIEGLSFKEATIEGKAALVVRIPRNTKIVEFKEDLHAPLRMVLYPEAPATSAVATDATLDNVQANRAEPQKIDKDFATVSPNPIGNQFNITYSLDQSAEVQASVHDFFGQKRLSVPTQKYTAGGTQTITIDSSSLPSGTYLIQMTINGMPYSKTVIKE